MKVQRDGRDFTVEVTADGEGLVSHAGSALLAQVAEKTGLTRALSGSLAWMRERRAGHDPGRVVRDLAVMLADGGDCLADLGAVRDQEPLFGRVGRGSAVVGHPGVVFWAWGRCLWGFWLSRLRLAWAHG